MCQRKYSLEIVYEAGLAGAKPISTSMELNPKLVKSTSNFFGILDKYCLLIGKLVYLTLTRPKLAYFDHTLTQFMQTPHVDHWEIALQVLGYGHP